MVEVERLAVSLTKNGYMKIGRLVEEYPSHQILSHVSGSIAGVNLVRSQVAGILCADPHTGIVPAFWDELRRYDRQTIRAFVFVAIIFSHHALVRLFRDAGHGRGAGTIHRDDIGEKAYTNLQFAMAEVGLCEYARGTGEVTYDMAPLTRQLAPVGDLVGRLLRVKLVRCGWRDPAEFPLAGDLPLAQQCVHERFNEIFGMSGRQFTRWIEGRPAQPR